MLRHARAAIAAVFVAALALAAPVSPLHAQGFPCQSPFPGQQAEQTTDCSSPKLTFGRVGGVVSASTIEVGSVAYASFGNATTYVSGTVYQISLFVPADMTVTNIACLNGGTVGTNSVIYSLYNSAGTRLAQTANAGAATAGANAFQSLALTAPIAVQGPGRYWIAVQANGTTDNLRTVAASTFVSAFTGSTTGTFGTLPAITPPTSFTANVGPICYVN